MGARNSDLLQNRLLAALPERDQWDMAGDLTLVDLAARDVLYEPRNHIKDVHFPTTAVVSMLATMEDGSQAEIATVGNEGMSGFPVFLGADRAPHLAITQVAGRALEMPAALFEKHVERSSHVRLLMQKYTQAIFNQVSQTAACNRLHPVEERCARWLLMTRDRAGSDEFGLTHDFIAIMLGVRRASVTLAIGTLTQAGFIGNGRGRVRILNATGLEEVSCECYAANRDEYERLMRDYQDSK